MKLVQILASIVAGFAMLASVGSASASAAEFNLSGTFAPTDADGTTGLAGGSFNGTYSYSGGAVPSGGVNVLSSFSINLLNASNTVVDTFNSNTNGDLGEIAGNPSNSGSDLLFFTTFDNDTFLELAFPIGFQGVGNLTTNNTFVIAFLSNPGFIYVTSASSTPVPQAVPEPSTIAGTIAAGAVLMAARLKKSKKRKAFQAA